MLEQYLSRLSAPALIAGGLMWIAIYALMVIIGIVTGKMAWPSPLHNSRCSRAATIP